MALWCERAHGPLSTFSRPRALSIGHALHQFDYPAHITVVAGAPSMNATWRSTGSVKRLHVCSLACAGGSRLEVREQPSGMGVHTVHVFTSNAPS